MAGLRVKKLTGLKLTLRISTGITGKSSMRGTCAYVMWLVVAFGRKGAVGSYVVNTELDEDY